MISLHLIQIDRPVRLVKRNSNEETKNRQLNVNVVRIYGGNWCLILQKFTFFSER